MPIYDVDDGTGRIFSIESDYEPSETELEELIASYQPEQSPSVQLLGPEARNVRPPMATTQAGSRIQEVAPLSVGLNEPAAFLGEFSQNVNTPFMELPRLERSENPSVLGDVGRGAANVGLSLAESLETPLGIASIPLAPIRAAQPILAGIFGPLMAKSAGEQLGEASVTGDRQKAIEGVLTGLLSAGITVGGRYRKASQREMAKDLADELKKSNLDVYSPDDIALAISKLPERSKPEVLPDLQRTADLVNQALQEATQKVRPVDARGIAQPTALEQLRAMENEILPIETAIAERPGGGEARFGELSYRRSAEAPTTEGFQELVQRERTPDAIQPETSPVAPSVSAVAPLRTKQLSSVAEPRENITTESTRNAILGPDAFPPTHSGAKLPRISGSEIEGISAGLTDAQSLLSSSDKAVGIRKAQLPNISSDSGLVLPKKLSDLFSRESILDKSGENIDINRARSMMPMMLDAIKNPEVFNSIIKLVPVDMVDMLSSKQFPAKELLHNPTMFVNALSTHPNPLVPLRVLGYFNGIHLLKNTIQSKPSQVYAIYQSTKGPVRSLLDTGRAQESAKQVPPDSGSAKAVEGSRAVPDQATGVQEITPESISQIGAGDYFNLSQKWAQDSMKGVEGARSPQLRAEEAARANPDIAKWEAAYDQAGAEAKQIMAELQANPESMLARQNEMVGAAMKRQFFQEGLKELRKSGSEKPIEAARTPEPYGDRYIREQGIDAARKRLTDLEQKFQDEMKNRPVDRNGAANLIDEGERIRKAIAKYESSAEPTMEVTPLAPESGRPLTATEQLAQRAEAPTPQAPRKQPLKPEQQRRQNILERAEQRLAEIQRNIQSGKQSFTGLGGLEPLIADGAITIARGALKATNSIAKAVSAAIDWVRKNHPNAKFDADAFRNELYRTLDVAKGEVPRPATAPTAQPASAPSTAGSDIRMRRSAARATESPMIPEPVQERIAQAPESFYPNQPNARVETVVKGMTPEQLAAVPADSNLFVASRIELADRLFKQGKMDEGYSIFVELEKQGTSFGQNINQFKRLPGTLPEHVAFAINKKLKNAGKDPLTPTQEAKAIELSRKSKESDAVLDTATDAWTKEPTDANAKSAEKALDKANADAVELQRFIGRFEPRSTSSILKAVLQGNLLTPMSQAANLVGNMAYVPFRAGTRGIASGIDVIDSYLRSKPREITVSPVTGTAEAAKGIVRGIAKAPEIALRGSETMKGESRAGLHPVKAWINQFSKTPGMPTTGGKLTWKDRANLLIEGTLGVPAEAMLRGLAIGDQPFREAAYSRVIANEAKLAKIPKEQLGMARKFPELFFDEPTLQRIQDGTMEAIFQRKSSTLNLITNWIKRKGDVFDFAVATVAPYKATPWNIVGEILSYNPVIAAVKTPYAAAKGNSRGAKINAGKLFIGSVLTGAGWWLYEKGLLSPSLDDRDETQKARVLAGEVIPPNHLNVSGLQRALQGGDPSFQPGDETVDVFKAGGLAGSMFYMTANIGRDFERKPEVSGGEYAGALATQGALENARFGLNQSFLSGVEGLLTAVKDGNTDAYLQQYMNTVASLPLPNTLTAMSRATRENKVDAKGDTFNKKVENIVRNRLGIAGADDYLPLKRGLWGEPMPETPEGRNSLVYQFFDITKNKQVTDDPVALELYRLWRKTGNNQVIPSIPTRSVTVDKKSYTLTPEQYSRYAELVGQSRRQIAEGLSVNPFFHEGSDEYKMDKLEQAYLKGLQRGKRAFLEEFPVDKLILKAERAGFGE